ncbi:MAG: hypothetical protein WDW19_00580 [Neisseriaceae bacterium]
MKALKLRWISLALFGLVVACSNQKSTETPAATASGNPTGPTLSSVNQKLAENCAKSNQAECKSLIENLANECLQHNAQSCVDSAVIFIKLNDEAVKAKNPTLASHSYNLAVSALVRACELKNQAACNSLKELSNNIYKNLKTLSAQCTQGSKEACQVISQAKGVLEKSCKAGRERDCQYLNGL